MATEQASSGFGPLLAPSEHRVAWRRMAHGLGLACLAVVTGFALVSFSRDDGQSADARLVVAAAPSAETAASVQGKVRVDVYGMAGCPFTRAFVEGPLSETVEIASEFVDVRLRAFGNSYTQTKQCGGTVKGMPFASYFKGYNATVRQCWDKLCGAAAEQPAEDCFSGPFIYQHGATEGMITTAWACAKRSAGESASKYMPFVRCTSLRFLGVTSEATFRETVRSCAAIARMDAHKVLTCATGPLGKQLLIEEARMTVQHPGVPYVVIDGHELGDTSCVTCGDGIMQKVCEAWRARGGKVPPSCQGIFGLL